MEKEQTNDAACLDLQAKHPSEYAVIMLNDDFTTMDFVVEVLETVFYKQHDEAESIMMNIHIEGSAVVGHYTYDIALSKINKVTHLATKNGFPLKVVMQKVD